MQEPFDIDKLPMPAGFPAGGFDRIDTPKGMFGPVGQEEIDKGSLATSRPSLLGAAFRTENTIGSAIASEAFGVPNDMDPAFKSWDYVKGSKFERHWPHLSGVMNATRMNAAMRDIERAEEDKRALDASPVLGTIASVTAAIADVPTLLPGGTFARGAQAGFSVARSAASVGVAAGVGTAVQEGALQATQQTRSGVESAVNIGSSVVLGGLLGAAGARILTGAEWRAQTKLMDRAMKDMVGGDERMAEFVAGAREGNAGNAGAMANPLLNQPDLTLDELTIAGASARAIGRAASPAIPSLRLGFSPAPETREVGERLLKNSVYLNMHGEGQTLGVATETAMIEHMGRYARSIQATDGIYNEARKAGMTLSPEEFRRVVGRAARRDDAADVADAGLWAPVKRLPSETDEAFTARIQDAVDPVTRAAKEFRSTLTDPLKELAIGQKLLDPDVKVDTASSYFSRMWQREKMIAREGEVKAIFRQHLASVIDEEATNFDRATARRLTHFDREIDDLEMAKLRRGEEMRQRDQDGGEAVLDDVSESDIRQAIRLVQTKGGPRPNVKTLTQFVVEAGGLVEDQGELIFRGITNKIRPGLVRKMRRSGPNDSGGGWGLDDMARHAWEKGYFPELDERPSINEFLDAFSDDVFKTRSVLRHGDRDAFRLQETVQALEMDLGRMGVDPASPRFSTSEELKGIVARVARGLDEETDQKLAKLRSARRDEDSKASMKRLERFGDPSGRDFGDAASDAAEQVFATLTGRTADGAPGYRVVASKAGPLKERTFNIPDRLVEDFLEDDVSLVGKRYARVMGADIELSRSFGDPTMKTAFEDIRKGYEKLRASVSDEKELRALDKRMRQDIADVETLRDQMRGNVPVSHADETFDRIVRTAGMMNYIRLMGGIVTANLGDFARVPMVHGFQALGLGPVASRLGSDLKKQAIRASVQEAQLAGNVLEAVNNSRLASLFDINDPYRTKGPVESFMERMTDVASKWNGIRIFTDSAKGWASTLTQNRILEGVGRYGDLPDKERRYLAFLGVDEAMSARIAKQFEAHGDTIDRVRVAGSKAWDDEGARRAYYGAINKDVDSVVVQQSRGDLPFFATTPMGRMVLQFKSYALASNQRVLMRGLQEDQARFWGGVIGMSTVGMMVTYLKALESNRTEQLSDNPGYWFGEGVDRSGIASAVFEVSNTLEKVGLPGLKKGAIGLGEVMFPGVSKEEGPSRYGARGKMGALLGPSIGAAEDAATVLSIPGALATDGEVKDSQLNAAKSLIPFGSYPGVKQFMNYVVLPPKDGKRIWE